MFSEEELYKAAIICELWRYSLPIRELSLARKRIDLRLKKTPTVFKEARKGKTWFFVVSLVPGTAKGFVAGEFTRDFPPTKKWKITESFILFGDQEIGKQEAPISAWSAIVISVTQVLMKL